VLEAFSLSVHAVKHHTLPSHHRMEGWIRVNLESVKSID